MSHGNRGKREEVRLVVLRRLRLIDELEIGLVHERRRRERGRLVARPAMPAGDLAQLVIEKSGNSVERVPPTMSGSSAGLSFTD
jgi:hypothetical protein